MHFDDKFSDETQWWMWMVRCVGGEEDDESNEAEAIDQDEIFGMSWWTGQMAR